MAEGKAEHFIKKTPDQLQNQIKWAKVKGHQDYKRVEVADGFANADQRAIKEAIAADQKKLDEMTPEQRKFSYSPIAYYYENYLENLRSLRRSQAEQITESMQNVPADRTSTEHYLQTISYPPEFVRQFIENLQPQTYRLRRNYTDEQIREAAKTEEGFKALVKSVIAKNPNTFGSNEEEIKLLFTSEECKHMITLVANAEPSTFLNIVSRNAELFTPQELKPLVSQAVAADRNKYSTYRHLADPEIAQLFTKDELRSMVQEALGKIVIEIVDDPSTDYYLTNAILTKGEIGQLIMNNFRSGLDFSRASVVAKLHVLSKFLDESQLNEAKERAYQLLISSNESFLLHAIKNLDGVLPEDQLKEIVQVRITKYPTEFVTDYGTIQKHLSPEERTNFIEEAVAGSNGALFSSYSLSSLQLDLLEDPDLSETTKIRFIEKLFTEYPGKVLLSTLGDLLKIYTPEDIPRAVTRVVENARPFDVWSSLDEWIDLISDDPVVQKQYLQSLMLQNNNYNFVTGYVKERNEKFRQLFTPEEIKGILYKKLELGNEDIFNNLPNIRQVLGSDQQLRQFIDQAAFQDPYVLLTKIDQLGYLYKPEEIVEFINKARVDLKGISACLDALSTWGPLMPKEYVRNFFVMYAPIHSRKLLTQLETCLGYIEEGDKQSFTEHLIRMNPAFALSRINAISRLFPHITTAYILQIGQAIQDDIKLAPLSLTEFYKDFPRITDEIAQKALIKDAADIYDYIRYVKYLGLTDDLIKAHHVERKPGQFSALPRAREVELLSIFQSFALLKVQDPKLFIEGERLGNSVDEAGMILLNKLSQHIGMGKEITPDEVRRFFAAMHTPAPFTIYYLEHESSPQHKKILIEMLTAILDGDFRQWKFANHSPEHFEAIKNQKLVPEKLTYEQYLVWAHDESTTLFDSLSAPAETVIDSIRDLITNNDDHLDFDSATLLGRPLDRIFEETQGSIAEIGQELAQINKQIAELRKINKSDTDEYNGLYSRRVTIEQERKSKVKLRNILKIMLLRPEELASGYFRDKTDPTKRVGLISDTLQQLRAQSPQEAAFVFDTINQLIENFHAATSEKQNLITTDSSDPKVMIEIGENPVSSCQHYAHGSFNDCLIGYSDPNTKILVIRNDKGSIIARSILRLLTDSEGNSALHLERIYSSVSSPAIPRSLYTHVLRKASQMGLKLYTTLPEQTEDQHKLRANLPEGLDFDKSDLELRSFASRTPKVYVDSAQGVRSFGQYSIKNLAEIKAA